MKVAHIALASDQGDTERQVELLVRTLAAMNVVQLALVRSDRLQRRLSRIRTVTARPCHSALSALLQLSDVDIVHAHDPRSVLAAYLSKRIRRIPYIITRRGIDVSEMHWFTRHAYRSAASVAAVSTAVGLRIHLQLASLTIELIPDGRYPVLISPVPPAAERSAPPSEVTARDMAIAYARLYTRCVTARAHKSRLLARWN